MKGVLELNWKIVLIIVLAVIAFIIVVLFTLGYKENIVKFFEEFSVKDLIESWRKALEPKQS
jgi:hypothetical protein